MIKHILIIVLVFAILVLGQQPYFVKMGKNVSNTVAKWASGVWQGVTTYWDNHFIKKVTTEIDKRQTIAKQEIKTQAKEVSLTLWQRVKNFFSNLFGEKGTAN